MERISRPVPIKDGVSGWPMLGVSLPATYPRGGVDKGLLHLGEKRVREGNYSNECFQKRTEECYDCERPQLHFLNV